MPNEKRKQIRIALCGVDGSGKTTQAKLLTAALEEKFGSKRVAYSHGNRPLFQSDNKTSNSNADVRPSKRNWLLSVLILKKDLLKIWLFVFQHQGAAIIIFDRYIEDALAKVRFHGQASKFLGMFADWFGPRSALTIWLDVPPEISFARDQEHSIEYHQKKRQAYAEVFQGARKSRCAIVSGSKSPDEVHAEIWRTVQKRLLSDSAGE